MFEEEFNTNTNTKDIKVPEVITENLKQDILAAMDKEDNDLSYKVFASVVADIIKNEYGSHNIKPFLKELDKKLK